MKLHIQNETSTLKAVVLGLPNRPDKIPALEDTYDAKSYESVAKGWHPTKEDIIPEMEAFDKVLKKHHVQVFRPWELPQCNQVFARDVGFVIENKFLISNIIPNRADEQQAYERILNSLAPEDIIRLPDEVHLEGGDVLLWNEFLFVGTYYRDDYEKYKTARTNKEAVEFLKQTFPEKWVVDMELKKHDTDPYEGILHLDCTFQPVGKDKAIIYKDGFLNPRHYEVLVSLFGHHNLFEVTKEEMYWMFPNVFSISPEVVVSEQHFTRLNNWLRESCGIKVEEIPYREVSKMGGLLRCSTLPLIRE